MRNNQIARKTLALGLAATPVVALLLLGGMNSTAQAETYTWVGRPLTTAGLPVPEDEEDRVAAWSFTVNWRLNGVEPFLAPGER